MYVSRYSKGHNNGGYAHLATVVKILVMRAKTKNIHYINILIHDHRVNFLSFEMTEAVAEMLD